MSSGWSDRDRDRSGGVAFGILLVVVGVMFLVAQQLKVDWESVGWPVWVIAPGLVLFALGLAVPHEGGLGMAIPGGIITTVGLILAFQDAEHAYGTWAYMWALVAPGSVGVTLFLFGLLHRKLDLVDSGLRTAAVGLGLFIGFGLFFENVGGLGEESGATILRDAMPFLAVAMGVVIVVINLLPARRHGDGRASSNGWSGGPTPGSNPPA